MTHLNVVILKYPSTRLSKSSPAKPHTPTHPFPPTTPPQVTNRSPASSPATAPCHLESTVIPPPRPSRTVSPNALPALLHLHLLPNNHPAPSIKAKQPPSPSTPQQSTLTPTTPSPPPCAPYTSFATPHTPHLPSTPMSLHQTLTFSRLRNSPNRSRNS